jgi:Zn-dependent alcohol dehydrogenase
MKALVLDKGEFDLSKGDEPLHIVEIPVREPLAEEVLIKITCCGI